MLTYTQAILIGALQGVTELFPISSLGHTVLLPTLLNLGIDQHEEFFLIFLVATHLATAVVLLGFYYKDWLLLIAGFFRTLKTGRIEKGDTYARLMWLLIIATVPAGLLGLVVDHTFRDLFAAPAAVAIFLTLNGFVLFGGEYLRKKSLAKATEESDEDRAIAKLSFPRAIGVGISQMLALFPGFSRTGSSLAGGLLAGLDHAAAVRFSFLLATPIIFAAAALKLPELVMNPHHFPVGPIIAGTIASGITAYLSVRFLTRYFKTNTLTPFAIYCVLAGIGSYILITFF